MGAQKFGNAAGGTSYAIQDIGKLKILEVGNIGKLILADAKHILGAASLVITGIDIKKMV